RRVRLLPLRTGKSDNLLSNFKFNQPNLFTMKKTILAVALLCSSLFTTSCDSVTGGDKSVGETVPVADYETYFASLKDDMESEGKRIAFEGYFFIGNDITYQDIPGLGEDLASIT